MAKFKQSAIQLAHKSTHKRTSQGGRKIKTSSMNKAQRRGYKKNRGQGR
jgi:hypothetical protein